MNSTLHLAAMLLDEWLRPGELARRPEDSAAMDVQDQVAAWHAQGDASIAPLYQLSARACSRMAPPGSTVVDLGCGSGRFAAFLARMRPDLRVLGVDLSPRMVDTGNAALRAEGLHGRVALQVGDMTRFAALAPAGTSVVHSLFAVHHLPDLALVETLLRQVQAVGDREGASFVLVDLARPRHEATCRRYPEALTPGAPRVFKDDSTNSLRAAYTHAELRGAIDRVMQPPQEVRSARSRLLGLYQAHWRSRIDARAAGWPQPAAVLPRQAAWQYAALRHLLLPTLPQ